VRDASKGTAGGRCDGFNKRSGTGTPGEGINFEPALNFFQMLQLSRVFFEKESCKLFVVVAVMISCSRLLVPLTFLPVVLDLVMQLCGRRKNYPPVRILELMLSSIIRQRLRCTSEGRNRRE
ncbi:hypothetical protein S245_026673, partial [Arachis hypogaea]